MSENDPSKSGSENDDKLILVEGPFVVVKDFADRIQLKPNQLIAELMSMNVFASINQKVDIKLAAQIADNHGYRVEMDIREEAPPAPPPKVEAPAAAPESKAAPAAADKSADKPAGRSKAAASATTTTVAPPEAAPVPVLPAKKKKKKKKLKAAGSKAIFKEGAKPPVVTFLGHVDHGKTTLLDYFRQSRVASGESGGITQHIGAYTVTKNGQEITFLDTPGHAAFSKMRMRGANLTDIAIIVIAADDGIKPQTNEAIDTVLEAGVTLMIAINKVDLASANVDRVKQQLQARDLTPEEWGGEIVTCEVSGKTGQNMDDLLDLILLQAEILELEAHPDLPAKGIVIEGELEPGRGPTATVLITEGTLAVGNAAVCGNHWGRIRSLIGDRGEQIKTAGPAHAVKILGLSGVPTAGSELTIEKSDRDAKKIAEERADIERNESLKAPEMPLNLADLLASKAAAEKKSFPVLLKTDVQGSVEAIVDALHMIKSEKVGVKFVESCIGTVTENDIILAKASGAKVLAFHAQIEPKAVKAAKREDVEIKKFDIIYELIDYVTETMVAMTDQDLKENVVGKAEIRQVFRLNKAPSVAGCVIIQGRVLNGAFARVRRKKDIMYEGKINSLRRFKDEAKEVGNGQECGIGLESFDDFKEGDVIEAFTIEKVARAL